MESRADDPPEQSSLLVGREAEVDIISRAVLRSLGGKTRGALISGEPGIGKTRLAQEACSAAVSRGVVCCWARWREGEEYPEYWAWRQLFGELFRFRPRLLAASTLAAELSELSEIVPEIRTRFPKLPARYGTSAGQSRVRLGVAVKRLLERAARSTPLLLVLDNLHLAGEASVALLSMLLEEIADTRLMVVATYRSVPADLTLHLSQFLSDMRAVDRVLNIPLSGIQEEAVEALVTGLTGEPVAQETLHHIGRICGGNPLFVRETARLLALASQPNSTINGSLWNVAVPHAMSTLIARRTAQLGHDCLRLLRQVAVAGEHFSIDEAAAADLLRSRETLEDGLSEAVRHGFLVEIVPGREYRFVHDVVREAIAAQLTVGERHATAWSIATEMEKRVGRAPAAWSLKLAGWFSECSSQAAKDAFRHYTRVAAETAIESGAWEQAVELYGKLLPPGMTQALSIDEADAFFGIGRAKALSGDWPAAVEYFCRAFDYFHSIGDLERMIAVATQPGYLQAGEPGFFDLYKQVLPLLPSGTLAEARVLHFYGIAQFNSIGDYSRAEELLSRSYDIAVRENDPLLQKSNLAALAFLDNAFERFDDALKKTSEALAIARHDPDPFGDAHAWFVTSCTLRMMGKPAEAAAYLDRAIGQVRLLRNGDLLANMQHEYAGITLLQGRWDDARREIDEGLEVYPEHLILLATRTFLEYTLGEIAVGDEFRSRILRLRRRTPAGPHHAHIHAASTAAVRARNTGDLADLPQWIPLLRSVASFPDCHPFIRLRAHLLLAFTAAQRRDATLAREQYALLIGLPRLHLVRPYLTERFLGLSAHCFGDSERAVKHLAQARRQANEYGDEPLEAWIACELAEALLPARADSPAPDDARRAFLHAFEVAKRLGMGPLEKRAAEGLEQLTSNDSTVSALRLHLTDREREILAFVARGLPNRAIADALNISQNTVANHLKSILAKTRTRNRTEAVHIAQRLGMLDHER